MANDRKTDALTTLRDRLAAHARDPRASMLGLSTTLQALQAGFDQIESQQSAIAHALAQVSMNLRRSAVQRDQVYSDDLVDLEQRMLTIAGGAR